MKFFAGKRIWLITTTMFVCTACVSTVSTEGGMKAPRTAGGPSTVYGDEHAVQATVGMVKAQGSRSRFSSRAIRLPERPLGEIAVFGYQFPSTCGGHEFRVYEAPDMQILEYQYAARNGETHLIRDYITGPSRFVEPGLWTAYDHTDGSIGTMTSELETSGDRMFKGVYSKGLVTNLPIGEQRALGNAYQQALSDAYACRL